MSAQKAAGLTNVKQLSHELCWGWSLSYHPKLGALRPALLVLTLLLWIQEPWNASWLFAPFVLVEPSLLAT